MIQDIIDGIDLTRPIDTLLPSALKGEVTKAFLNVLARPVRVLLVDFINEALDVMWFLKYNCTTYSMEEALNAYFTTGIPALYSSQYFVHHHIYVEDGVEGNEVLVYPKDLHIVQRTPVRLTLGTTWGARPFIVRIPDYMQSSETEEKVDRLVRILKLYGTSYRIVYYHAVLDI